MNKAVLLFVSFLIIGISLILLYRYWKKHNKKNPLVFLILGTIFLGFSAILLVMFVYIMLIIASAAKAIS